MSKSASPSSSPATLVWLRNDLRLADNPALHVAAGRPGPVIPVFIWEPEEEDPWRPGAASAWWLHHSLASLDEQMRARGSRLLIRRGPSLSVLRALARETGADTVLWNRRYEPALLARDRKAKEELRSVGLAAHTFNAALLYEPWALRSEPGTGFQVFTPFWRACVASGAPPEPLAAPATLRAPRHWPASLPVLELRLLPVFDWAAGIRATWTPGELGAQDRLQRFLREAVSAYDGERNHPDVEGTSRLSPHLHFGEIGPRQIWHAIRDQLTAHDADRGVGADTYVKELGWREFAYHLLFHYPHTTDQPLRPAFSKFAWEPDPKVLRAWQRGRTGYPLVDAGMRQLWRTGWMHNRVRMIVASLLVKDLLQPWQNGAAWFWDTLVDADLANNTLGWQWTAGCGADAAPFFRIFNPVLQGERFDPNGNYIRQWVPELKGLSSKHVHAPWRAPASALREAGITLGREYPAPLIDHEVARARALAAYARVRAAGSPTPGAKAKTATRRSSGP